MRKTILYLLVLAVLGVGVWYVLFRNSDNNIFGASEAGFTIPDTGSIGKIYMARTDGTGVTIEREGNGWKVNKQYDVLKSSLKSLMSAMAKQVADYPVPESEHNMVIKSIAGNGVKVEVYNREGKKMRVYYVGDEVHNFMGTYMLMEGAKRPYVVNIPGFDGYLTPRYTTNIKDWQDRNVFDFSADQIRSVTIKYDESPLNNFVISQDDKGKVSVKLDSNLTNLKELNEERATKYLTFFQNVNCVGYVNGAIGMDSIIRSVPRRCTVDVLAKDGTLKHIDVYWHILDRRSKNTLTPMKNYRNEFDSDRFYAIMNNGKDTAVIQRFIFDKIFRNGYEFYEKNLEPQPEEHLEGEIQKKIQMK
ncbi:DUF4340 domain-containing protein [Taibaiella soli]|uniref:DUF4340 domain-containing protein n=1 Tax=Taibaiella soli TaxID=1649169 RepID=A0A2W2AFJ9_9BACT|nr:DUF4340 domain-containing protein [Taibaiella soli]PZF72282.1 hypothetical protein DN068_13040 [Taibaiella soli]